MTDAPEKIWVDTIRNTDDGAIVGGGEFPLSTGGISYTRTDLADAAERAAYLRGMEDAAKVADGMPQGVWHDEEGNAAGSRPATPREVAAAIRALAKEAGE